MQTLPLITQTFYYNNQNSEETGLPAKNGEKAGKYGWSDTGNRRAMSGSGGEAPSCRKQGGVGAEPPATENFCIFYLKK